MKAAKMIQVTYRFFMLPCTDKVLINKSKFLYFMHCFSTFKTQQQFNLPLQLFFHEAKSNPYSTIEFITYILGLNFGQKKHDLIPVGKIADSSMHDL